MLTQFIDKNLRKQDNQLRQYVQNVLLKVHAKVSACDGEEGSMLNRRQLNGTNWSISLPPKLQGVMFLGADVTHSPAARGSAGRAPSIAAVVGSVDKFGQIHAASVREQEGGKEMIVDLQGESKSEQTF